LNAIITQAQTSWSALPLSMLQLASIAGLPQCLGIVAGAYLGRVALWSAANGTRLVFRG
jgi:hypothetical protein